MAQCKECGTQLGFFNTGSHGFCTDCHASYLQKIIDKRTDERSKADQAAEVESNRRDSEIRQVLLTTEVATDLRILRRIDIITAECAFGINLLKDLLVNMRDIFGGRSETLQKLMKDSRQVALDELRREAYLLGGNAVVGVNLTYTQVSSAGSAMILLVASGTAVELE